MYSLTFARRITSSDLPCLVTPPELVGAPNTRSPRLIPHHLSWRIPTAHIKTPVPCRVSRPPITLVIQLGPAVGRVMQLYGAATAQSLRQTAINTLTCDGAPSNVHGVSCCQPSCGVLACPYNSPENKELTRINNVSNDLEPSIIP